MTTPNGSFPPPGSYPPGPGSPARGRTRNPALRASDADRDQVLTQLSEHYQAGRLTSAEFDERSSRALQARTMGDLSGLLTDLPPVPAAPVSTPGPASGTGRLARSGLVSPVTWAVLAVLAVLGVVAVIGVLSHTGQHWSFGGWGVIIPVLIILRIAAGRRGHHQHRD
jgi:hypothetical protein